MAVLGVGQLEKSAITLIQFLAVHNSALGWVLF